ncbi:hypothetical protein RND71_032846 [Anisodus tanguticus]|uniref:Uncharacterized protein n=1 Tax=Anisodus tanguticus TaxID=243964 RepID=A0AAE1UWZ5_9SOLA|nr:hypothetical protein RND71_032846 [Anisodus tanguticus]
MANIQHICVFCFLLVVIVEGRQFKALKKTKFADNAKGKTFPERQHFSTGDTSTVVTGKVNYTPTKTGNSPGIGHSSSVPKANYQPNHTTVERSIDDLKAGHSPGIGHYSQSEKIGPNV